MEKGKIDNKMLVLGNASFMKENLKGMTKEFFDKHYKGKIRGISHEDAWKEVKKHTK